MKEVPLRGLAGLRALILCRQARTSLETEEACREMESLARTLRITVVRTAVFPLHEIHPATYVGKGKLQEFHETALREEANLLLFDQELSAVQHRNIEETIERPILDRTGLILRIFAEHARTHEGKIQVELAQLNYLLPRLTGQGIALSRLGGGVGTRGPGEMKLEVYRRRIKEQIHRLNERIKDIEQHRKLLRDARERKHLLVVSLLGYTNVGKSTLLNRLSRSRDVAVADQLFSTLDPTTRRIHLGDGEFCLMTDTVGLLHALPHHLIAAFQATLDEAVFSDALLCLYDGSAVSLERQRRTTAEVLQMLGMEDKPALEVFTKMDLVAPAERNMLRAQFPQAVFISGRSGDGLEELKQRIREVLHAAPVA